MQPVDPSHLEAFESKAFSFYEREGRDLPWRYVDDPYEILVSELMLQQTQVGRVLRKYSSFMTRFPTIEELARADFADVLRQWQGLGYNRRARSLHQAAGLIVDRYNGIVPEDTGELATLPGIGRYTAGAIACFAYNRPVPFLETNVRRALIYEFYNDAERVQDRELLAYAALLAERNQAKARRWGYALMDYGAALGRRVPNPNRKSAHYTRQAPFAGSDRQLRGRILRTLVEQEAPAETEKLIAKAGFPRERVMARLDDLAAEGLIVKENGTLRLPRQGDTPSE